MRVAHLAVLAAVMAAPVPAVAQTGPQFLVQGIDAFRALEMEAATRMLRLSLGAHDLPEADRTHALAYLGAAEFYRDRRDSAFAAFERLIQTDPRYRLDRLAFAPRVLDAFDQARRQTMVVAVETVRRVTFEPGRGGLATRLYPSTPHHVRVRIEDAAGRAVRTLHDGLVEDSARVVWDGRGARRRRLAEGLYNMSVSSMGDGDEPVRTVDVPIRLARTMRDSLVRPPAPDFLPQREPLGPGLLRLGLGLGAAGAALVVVPVFTDNDGPKFATALVLAAAGVIGFFERRPGRPYPDNVVANEVRRAAWEARVAEVAAENRRRRPGERIVLETGRVAIRR